MFSGSIVKSNPQGRALEPVDDRLRHPRWPILTITRETAHVLPIVVPVAAAAAVGLSAAIAALIAEPPGAAVLAGVGGLLAAATLAEAFPLPIEGVIIGATSLATVFIVAAAAIYGWREAAVVGFLTMLPVELGHRRPLVRVVFNTALYVCAAIGAGLASGPWRGGELASIVGGGLRGSAAFYVVDLGLLAAVVARIRGLHYVPSLRWHLGTTILPFLVMASLTVTLIVLWDRSPLVSVVLAGPLIAIALYERWLHDALERLREFDRLKDEFIAVISHELRTPLTSVYGAALTLKQRDVQDEMRESLLEIVADEAGRLARLLDHALSASRLHAKSETFEIAPTDGGAIARAVVEAARPRLPQSLEIQLACAPGLPPVAADPDKLRQVLVNLVENAIKYSPDGGRIEVSVMHADTLVRFSVRDEGIGVPKHEQAHIFERFQRLDPSATRGVAGTGLGLYICREIVQNMNGRIWVTSREGSGSAFTFELPVADFAA